MKQLRCILSVLCAICIVICAVSGTVVTVFAADEFIIQDGILTAYTGISESVVIPDGVKIIGSNAFKGNKTVTSVTIPYGVKTIGDSAFADCNNLSSVEIPNTVTSVSDWAFSSTRLETVTIPFSVINVGFGAFTYYGSTDKKTLKTVYINNKYTTFGEHVFDGREDFVLCAAADSETKIYADNNGFAFSEYTPVVPEPIFNIENGVLISASSAVGEITIPDGVKEIGSNAFASNAAITAVYIPEGVEKICDAAFNECVNLRKVKLPNSLVSISDWAFSSTNLSDGIIIPYYVTRVGVGSFANFCSYNNESLKDIYFYNPETEIANNAFDHRAGNPIIHSASGSSAEKYVQNIKQYPDKDENKNQTALSFNAIDIPLLEPLYTVDENGLLTAAQNIGGAITLPDNVKEIAPNVFKGNKSITSVTFGEGVKKIDSSAFAECVNLKTVSLPYSLEEIGDWCFYNTQLNTLTLPNDVVTVGEYAFACNDNAEYADKLKTVNVFSQTVRLASGVFQGRKSMTLRSSAGSTAESYAAQNGFAFEAISIPPAPVVQVEEGEHHFSVNSDGVLTKYSGTGKRVTIPQSLGIKEIAPNAFADNKDVIEVIIPEGVIKIGNAAFSYCKNLSSVTLPQSLYTIEPFAFCGTALKEITLKHKVSYVGAGAFSFIDSAVLAISVYNSECRFIDEVCGSPNKNAVRMMLGAAGSTAGSYANAYSYIDFREITVPDEPQTVYEEGVHKFLIKDGKLYGYEGTGKKVTIPDNLGIYEISDNAFKGNLDINEVIIPYGVELIRDSAFSGCKNLKRVTLPAELCEIGPFAFCDTALESVIIPHDVEKVGVGAFAFISSPVLSLNFYNPDCVITDNDICSVTDNTFRRIILSSAGSSAEQFAATKDYCEFRSITIPPRTEIEIEEGVHNFMVKNGVLLKYEGTGKKVTIPANLGIKEIASNAFKDQTQVQQVIIPEGVEKIGDSAFSGCSSLRFITLPSTLTEICDWAFCACNIKKAEIPKSCKVIGLGAFGFSKARSTTLTFYNEKIRIGADLCTTVNEDYPVTFIGYTGSSAERYAKRYKYTFISLDGIPSTGDANTLPLAVAVLLCSCALSAACGRKILLSRSDM